MNKEVKFLRIISMAVILIFACDILFAQTSKDTVNPGKTNDAMVVTPGITSDSMAVKPEKTNDAMAALTDTGFISKNITDNMMEIKLAALGQRKGTSSQVKRVAALMITDHTIILNDLKKLAAKKGISLKNYIPSMPIDIVPGRDFDKTWASQMLIMHEAKIAELENYISQSADKDIKAAAGRALPKIKMHRNLLMKISGARSKTGIA